MVTCAPAVPGVLGTRVTLGGSACSVIVHSSQRCCCVGVAFFGNPRFIAHWPPLYCIARQKYVPDLVAISSNTAEKVVFLA